MTAAPGATIRLAAVGDVFVDRRDADSAYADGDPVLAAADIAFANCEGVFGTGLEPAVTAGAPVVAGPEGARALARAGLDVVSLAHNHLVDGGLAGVASTLAALHGNGIQTAGAGADRDAAHRPAILRRGGLEVAVLAYASVFPHGYEAGPARAGLAAIRTRTWYEPAEPYLWDPGAAPVVRTEEVPEDLDALVDDVRRARQDADGVAVSLHAGDMHRPFVLREHERRIAHAAVDAGAGLVLGHHHHMLRGIEFYRGAPIWYGLGHHLFDLPDLGRRVAAVGGRLPEWTPALDAPVSCARDRYLLAERPGFPLLPFHPDGRLSGIAVMDLTARGVVASWFVPAVIGPDNAPRPVDPESPDGRRVVDYLRRAGASQGLAVDLAPETVAGLPVRALRVAPPAPIPAPAPAPTGEDTGP